MLPDSDTKKTEYVSLWNLIKSRLSEEIPEQSFLTWFEPIEPISFNDDILTLGVPNNFHLEWIESHYSKALQQLVTDIFENGASYSLIVTEQHAVPDAGGTRHKKKKQLCAIIPETAYGFGVNSNLTFDDFIEGDCNRFVRAAASSIARAPGKTAYNPLLIFGSSGLGKTHLMHAIGNYVISHQLAKRVTYVTSEKFTADFVHAIQTGSIDTFSKMYRSTDLLLVDDVQFFMSKDRTQEEFFHTFNSLKQEGKQLVFSSDRPPRDLDGFDERLISRLQWGLVGELKKPDFETRLAIIHHIARKGKQIIPDDVADFIARYFTDNIRSIEGAVTHLLAQSSLIGLSVNLVTAHETLRHFIATPVTIISVDKIQDAVAEEFQISGNLLRAKTRKSEIAFARQVAMYLCTAMCDLTLQAIGLHFGGRDHTTVIHAKNTILKQLESNRQLQEAVERIKKKVETSAV